MALIRTDMLGEITGDTISRTVTVTDEDGATRDITNDTLRATFGFSTPVTLSEGSGITITDAANGVLTWELTDVQTTAAGPGTYNYGIKLEDASGDERTLVYGRLELLAQRVE